MSENSPHQTYAQAINQIKRVDFMQFNDGSSYLIIVFKEDNQQWIKYIQDEMFFRLNHDEKIYKLTATPTIILPKGLVVGWQNELRGILPYKIGFFGEPQHGKAEIVEVHFDIKSYQQTIVEEN